MSALITDAEVLQQLNAQQAWHYQVIPFSKDESALHLYCSEQADIEVLQEELSMLLDQEILLTPQPIDKISASLSKHYRLGDQQEVSSLSARDLSGDGGTDVIGRLIDETASLGGSDIHFEPYEHAARVRIRIDGALIEKFQLPLQGYPSLVNQVKIRANLDIAEKRLPQDGRIQHQWREQQIDIRVSILPSLFGEKIVMRLLVNKSDQLELDDLGLSGKELQDYLEATRRPSGVTLISGPTGSGKTTTLYATLRRLNEVHRNIVTIEDPIEYTLHGINQVQLREAIGMDFANALRTFLRQDPDTIMVGEIRDLDTASMAIRASLTGHQVFSTIHTNHAWGIISRLLDMGVPPYLLADTLNAAVAQRLIRLLCPHCKQAKPIQVADLPAKYATSHQLEKAYHPFGCAKCFFTGYQGRQGIYEVILVDRELAACIRKKKLDIKELLQQKGIKSLSEQAFVLLKEGLTSPQEVYALLN